MNILKLIKTVPYAYQLNQKEIALSKSLKNCFLHIEYSDPTPETLNSLEEAIKQKKEILDKIGQMVNLKDITRQSQPALYEDIKKVEYASELHQTFKSFLYPLISELRDNQPKLAFKRMWNFLDKDAYSIEHKEILETTHYPYIQLLFVSKDISLGLNQEERDVWQQIDKYCHNRPKCTNTDFITLMHYAHRDDERGITELLSRGVALNQMLNTLILNYCPDTVKEKINQAIFKRIERGSY